MRGPQPEGLPPSHKGIYPSLEGRNGGRGGGERRENEYIHVCVSVYVCVCEICLKYANFTAKLWKLGIKRGGQSGRF